jgi:hypothetical protein
MREETYIEALRNSLMTFRTSSTEMGKIEMRMQEARDRQDAEESLHWEAVWEKFASDRPGIAASLLQAMCLFQQAGAQLPNPRWKTPPWVFREWQSFLLGGLTETPRTPPGSEM